MKALKIVLVLALCLSVLMVAGCKSEEKKGQEPDKDPETTAAPGGDESTPSGEEDVFQNPEGDPGVQTPDGPDLTEPPIGVQDGEDDQQGEEDFDVDFGDLVGG